MAVLWYRMSVADGCAWATDSGGPGIQATTGQPWVTAQQDLTPHTGSQRCSALGSLDIVRCAAPAGALQQTGLSNT